MSDPSSPQASSNAQHSAASHAGASRTEARRSAAQRQPRRSRLVAVAATALSGLLVTTGLVSLAVNAAPAAKAATYTPYSGSTTINTTSQSAVQTAFNDWYTPTTTVPINWTQPSNCLAGSGSNDAATSQSGLDAVNFYRAMAGLPTVTDYPTGDGYDQAAVTMIEGAGGGIAYEQANPDPHHPASTATCYTSDGATGTASSDLDFGTAGVANSAAAWVAEWIDDFGTNNVQELGHRRWVFNPPTTSMGMAYGPTSAALGVMSPAAEGSSDTTTTDVAWPSAGYFPYELLPTKSNQWSYSIPGADFSNAAVTVTKNGTAYPVTVQTLLSGYGQSTISWILGSAPARPAYGSTDDYHVTISGIDDANGEVLPNVSYDVNLFNASLGGGSVAITPTTAGAALAQGTSLTAATSGFPAGTSLSYQWNDVSSAGTTPIAGATGSTYTPTASDAGQYLSVTVTATLVGFPTATITSSTTADYVPYLSMGASVAVAPTANVGVAITPTITGSPAGATVSYSWTNAAGTVLGTDSSYTPTLSDANTTITLNITISASGYYTAHTPAIAITINPAALAGTVSITGTPAVGSTLTATPASFPSGTTYTYQWYTGPITGSVTPITGATGATYTPVAADLGKYLDVQITATAAGFSNSPYQNATQTQTTVAQGTFSGSVKVTGASGTPTGTAQVGDTLTATPSGYPNGTAYTYQWYQGATAINAATSSTYTVTAANAGQNLSVQLGASLSGYTSATVPSTTTPVALMTMSGSSVSISGTPAFGNVLTATTTGFPAGAALSYQWSSNGSPISGATGSTYTPVIADVGNTLTVTVNATATGYNPGSATSPVVTVAEQTMSGTVSVSGTATVGQTVTAQTTNFPAGVTLSYQWYLGATPISGATDSTYTIAPADSGQSLSVKVTASATGYTTATVPSTAVTVGALTMSGSVSISGTAAVGSPLTATPSGFPTGSTYTYQWFSGSTAISGATSSAYTPVTADAGASITVQLTASATGYNTKIVTSDKVTVALLTMSGSVSISGTAAVGSPLTATPSSFPTGSTYTYQWFSGSTAISGATSSTYTPVTADAGASITVQLTATATGYTAGTATSPPVSVPLQAMNGTVSVSGTAVVGNTLTANPSSFPTGAIYTYQWYRGSTAISGATSSTYVLVTADAGQSVSVQVTASATGYSQGAATSSQVSVPLQVMVGTVSVSGTATVGSALTANPASFPTGASFTYQWYRGSSAISGATSSTYTLQAADAGQSVSVRITASATDYSPQTVPSSAVIVAAQTMPGSVSITGTPAVGSTLTAGLSGFPSGASFTYQWYRGAVPMVGATSATYTPVAADAGQSVSVQVTATATGYTTATASSAPVSVPLQTMSGSVSITGTPAVASTLTANPAGFPTGATFTYQWYQGTTAIANATAPTYTPVAADAGQSITVKVTATASGYSSATVPSSAVSVPLQAMSGSVSVSGTAAVGSTLTANPSGFPTGATFTYQWSLGSTAISGATASTYTPVTGDGGQSITVQVVATAAGYTSQTVTSPAVTVADQPSSGTVAVTGTTAVGSTLTATPSGFSGNPTFTYQWYRGATSIAGATAAAYTLAAADAGQSVNVQVTATASGYTTVTASSQPVTVANQAMNGSVSVSGTAVVGNTLTANPASFPTGVTFTYQWYRGSTGISGATSSTYTLAAADAGQSVSVKIIASATGYSPQTVSSSAVTVAAQTMPGSVSVTGTPAVGSVLTATLSGFPTGATFTYQWYRGSTGISGATSTTYTPVSADAGQSVSVQVTATATGYNSATVPSSAVTVAVQTMNGTVSITGTADVGSQLTANLTGFPTGVTYTYQWLSGGTAISGATASTYTPVTTNAGQKLTVQVTASATGYATATVTSAAVTVSVPLQNMSGAVTVSGAGTVGSTLTAGLSGFPSGASFSYQWNRSGIAISGATSSSYTLQALDAGQPVTVTVTATASGYNSDTVSSSPITVATQAMSGTVSISGASSGAAAVGTTLTATPSGFPVGASYRYQWYRDSTAISGATAATYTTQTADAGHTVSVKIAVTATGYTPGTASSASVTVTTGNLTMSGTVTISGAPSGTATVGTTLTAVPSGFPAGASYTYQWYQGGTGAISGATSSTYTVQAADSGQLIVVKITATATGYNSGTASSAPVTVAVQQNLTMTGTIAISGSQSGYAAIGVPVTANLSGFTAAATYSYQWYRGSTAISGATGPSYTPVKADSGSSLSVQVTATASGYTTASATSATVKVAAAQAAVTRIAGADRYATANAAAQSMYPNGASTVFLMDGLNFPDALAAAPAAAKLGAPILLTQPNTLTGSTLAELNKLKPKTIYVLGQTPSVSAATFAQVQSQVGSHPKVVRIGGSDRFVTSQMLAQAVWGSNAKTVFIATGMDYTDGEAAAAAAAKAGAPLLLVNGSLSSGSVISSAVANQLKTWKPTTIHVVGDTAKLTPAVYNALASTGATIDRTSGATPAATAIAVAQTFFGTSSQAFIATDDAGAFSDALVAGALAGKAKGPVLFSDDSLSTGVASEVLALGASNVTVMGNDLRISTASIQALQQAIGATTSIS